MFNFLFLLLLYIGTLASLCFPWDKGLNLHLMNLGERTELTVFSLIEEKMMKVYGASENKESKNFQDGKRKLLREIILIKKGKKKKRRREGENKREDEVRSKSQGRW